MKTKNLLLTICGCLCLFLSACDFFNFELEKESNILFHAGNTLNNETADTLLFTGKDLIFYNDSTHELCFKDTIIPNKLKSYRRITCFIGSDSLFTATLTSDFMSFIVNDLVLNHNLFDGKYYFDDGYPGWIDNLGATTIRAQNKAKREESWNRFLSVLKEEGKLIE